MVLDGRDAPTPVMEVVNSVNSVNPKSLRYGNTEPSVKACVENRHGASNRDEGMFRTLQKCNELPRNEATICKDVTFLIVSTIVGRHNVHAPTPAMEVVQVANSVKAKTSGHANTELNSQRCDKCVENIDDLSHVDKDMFRAYKKLYEAFGNETLAHYVCSNKTDHRFCPHDKALSPILVMGLVHCPNSVNPKLVEHGNTEPSMNLRFKACVENIQAASIWKKICSEPQGNLWSQPEMS